MMLLSFIAGFTAGGVVAAIGISCLSVGAYNKGYDDGLEEFKYRKGSVVNND